MRLKSNECNAALAVLIALGTSVSCGEDPVSTGVPGNFGFAGTIDGGGRVSNTSGGSSPLGSGGTVSTGGTFSTGGASGGTPSLNTGGMKAGGSGGMASGGKGSATGGSGGSKATATGGSGGRSAFGTGGRSSGGSGGKGAGGSAAVAFSAIGSIIGTRCSTCHGFTMPMLQNNAMLRDTLTMTRVPDCGNNPLVTPNDASKSAILMLVNRMCAGGLAMPQGCAMTPCIPAADVTTITNWINSGAPP